MHVSNWSKVFLWVVASSSSLKQLLLTTRPKNERRSKLHFCWASTRRLQQTLNFLGEFQKISGLYSSPKGRIRLQNGKETLQLLRYTELRTGLGSEACTLFHLGTDVRYAYISGVNVHTCCTISKHRYELAARFSR